MSENEKKDLVPQNQTKALDLTDEELKIYKEYKDAGFPGIMRVQQSDIFKWINLYMNGKSYFEIARDTKSNIAQIITVAVRQDWAKKKFDHFDSVHNNLGDKLMINRLESLVFLSDVQAYVHQTLGRDIKNYLQTQDPTLERKIDLKVLDKYIKAVDLIGKLAFNNKSDDPNRPQAVFNNFFGKTSIRKTGENTVEVEVSEPDDDLSIIELEAIKAKTEQED